MVQAVNRAADEAVDVPEDGYRSENTAITGPSALVIGAGGGLGSALCRGWLKDDDIADVHAVSRQVVDASIVSDGPVSKSLNWLQCDYSREGISESVAELEASGRHFSRICICNGILHDDDIVPEKRLEEIDSDAMLKVMDINAVLPMVWLSALLPLLHKKRPCVITVFSARIGSIGDNRSGGWYSYRASKAALNMLMRSAAIELQRRYPAVKLIAFHPGTTDTGLSRPYQHNLPAGQLLDADHVAACLLEIMNETTADGTLSYVDWENKPIEW